MSRSPNQVMAAVRGIGVAVMTSRCGAVEPLAFNDSRCSTPKRCCSSMTASARLGAWKVLENAACVATTMHGCRRRLREDASAGGKFHAAGEQQYGNVRQAVRLAVQQFLHLAAIRLSTVLRFRRVSRRDLSTFIHNRMVR